MVYVGLILMIYYMCEIIDGNIEFYFGEGEIFVNVFEGVLIVNYIGGFKFIQNFMIVIEYISINGVDVNGVVGFLYVDILINIIVININENLNDDLDFVGVDGGGDLEDIECICELGIIKCEI